MPNVNDLSKFLQASDVSDGAVVIFKNAGELVEIDYSKKKDGSDVSLKLQITVELPNGKTKLYTMNTTSNKAIAAKYGPDTENWIGQPATVELIKQNVGGDIKTVVYLR